MNKLLFIITAATLMLTLLTGTTFAQITAQTVDLEITAGDAIVERALKKCGICHGKTLHGKRKAPAIAGLTRAKIFKSLTNPPRQMKPVARGLTTAQKRAVAAIVSKAPKKAPKDAPAKPAATPPAEDSKKN